MDVAPPDLQIPSHIPPDRIIDFDFFTTLPPGEDAQTFWVRTRDRTPDVFYTPRNGGHWVAMRAREIERIQLEHETFSHEVIALPRATHVPLMPLTLDPPRHEGFRRLINPAFTPRAVAALEERARIVARRAIDGFAARGHCEFFNDFARVLPIEVFMGMVDLPAEDRTDLLSWAEVATRSSDVARRHEANANMTGYLVGKIAERRATPGPDLLSQVLGGKVEGRDLTADEGLSVCMLLLFGGLDTVSSMLSFIARFLALNPVHCRELAENPALIPQATEELLRRHGVVSTARLVKRTVELGGAVLGAGEMVLAPNCLVGLDDRVVEDPMRVDFHRPAPAPMGTFGKGPHLCPGATLGRREIKVFIEEWLARIPAFGIAPGTTPLVEAGMVSGVTRLELAWSPQ